MSAEIYLWLLTIAIAAVPAFAVFRGSAETHQKLHTRLLVVAGVLLYLVPLAFVAALILMLRVFGIDMFD